ATITVQLAGAFLGPVALLFGHALGQATGGIKLARLSLRGHRLQFSQIGRILTVGNRYRQFPIYSSWAALLGTAGSQLPPIMFAALFSPSAAGLYALAHRVV